jgi:hypothetical protein
MVALGSSDRLQVAVRDRLLLEDDVGVARPWRMQGHHFSLQTLHYDLIYMHKLTPKI